VRKPRVMLRIPASLNREERTASGSPSRALPWRNVGTFVFVVALVIVITWFGSNLAEIRGSPAASEPLLNTPTAEHPWSGGHTFSARGVGDASETGSSLVQCWDGSSSCLTGLGVPQAQSNNILDPVQVRLRRLVLSGLEIGEFRPYIVDYSASVPLDESMTTVVAIAMHDSTAILIEPPDADQGEAGHQVALGEVGQIVVTVSSIDTTESRSYRIALEPAGDNQRPVLSANHLLSIESDGEPVSVRLSRFFRDPESQPLRFRVGDVSDPEVAAIAIRDGVLTVVPLRAGDAWLRAAASDGDLVSKPLIVQVHVADLEDSTADRPSAVQSPLFAGLDH